MKRSFSLSFETGPAPPKVQIIGMGMVSFILMALAVWQWLEVYELERDGSRATGYVVGLEKSGESLFPVFQFTDDKNRSHTVRSRSSSGGIAAGDSIEVLYPTNRPLDARIDVGWRLYFLVLVFGGLSVAFLLGALLVARFRGFFAAEFSARKGKLSVTEKMADGSIRQSTRSSIPLLLWTSRVFGAIGLILLLAAVWFAWTNYEFSQSALRTSGTVIDLVRTGANHRPTFEFTDNVGAVHRVASRFTMNDHLVGDEIQIIYSPADPQAAQILRHSTFVAVPAYLGFVAMLVFLVTAVTRYQLSNLRNS